MVGGLVKETIHAPGRVWINCIGTGGEAGVSCAIYVESCPNAWLVKPGDSIWWQRDVYWTPLWAKHQHPDEYQIEDVVLKRASYSGVSKPKQRNR